MYPSDPNLAGAKTAPVYPLLDSQKSLSVRGIFPVDPFGQPRVRCPRVVWIQVGGKFGL